MELGSGGLRHKDQRQLAERRRRRLRALQRGPRDDQAQRRVHEALRAEPACIEGRELVAEGQIDPVCPKRPNLLKSGHLMQIYPSGGALGAAIASASRLAGHR